jgi:hypothetical protein
MYIPDFGPQYVVPPGRKKIGEKGQMRRKRVIGKVVKGVGATGRSPLRAEMPS